MKIKVYLTLICLWGMLGADGQVKILFDCTKAETAGNADWVIDADQHNIYWQSNDQIGSGSASNPQRYPTPLQSTVTSGTSETYWEGALSAWGIDCVKYGYEVETLPPTGLITYGDTSNPQDLSNYKVYIVDEPNILFNATEKAAMLNFVKNGGGLFMISDHAGSDRNNDGYDSPTVWNDFLSTYNNPFGFTWALNNFSETTTNVPNLPGDSLLHGPYGAPTEMQYSNGTSLILNPTINPTVKGVVYETGCSNTGDTGVMMCYARYGYGKIVGTGDSSPEDDGTGNPACTLYNGWTTDASGNHEKLVMNATIWLAETSVPVVTDSLKLLTASDTTICSGSALTMTATGATTYLWEPGGATTASITVHPSASGQYMVTGISNGASKNDTVTVTVDQFSTTSPTVTAGGPTTFCGSGSVVLTAPSAASYHWSTGSTQQSITATSGGSYYLTLTDNNGCTALSNTINVSVDPFSNTTPQISVNGPVTFCAGGNVTLTSPAESSYSWSNTATTESISVSASGTYKVTVSDNNNCSAVSNSITVSVDAFSQTHPVISASGPEQFCTGGSVTLSAPGGDTYLWNNSSTQQSITVGATGKFYLTVTDANNCSAISDTANVTVGSSLTGVQITPNGSLSLCVGNNAVVTAPSGYTSYSWNTGSSQQSITVTQAGTYYVNLTATGGCSGVSDVLTVSVDSFSLLTWDISVTGATTFCAGDSAVLISPSASSYLWSNNSIQQQITATQTGNYSVTITDFNNCTAATGSKAITVNPLPAVSLQISPDSICLNGGPVSLTAGNPSGGTYSGIGVSGTQFNPTVGGAGVHVITYTYTDANSCTNTATQGLDVEVCTGIEAIPEHAITIYPNPTTGQFTIQLAGTQNFYPVEIYNVMGQKVEQTVLTNTQNTLNLSNQPAGMYFINVQMESSVATGKILVTK